MKIAVTGKGGVGKTTIAATLARLYAEEGHPVLAADVDPDANLGLALGFPEEILDSIVPITKMRKLIEERTEASADNRFYKINPRVSDIPDKYSKEYNGVKLLTLGTVVPSPSRVCNMKLCTGQNVCCGESSTAWSFTEGMLSSSTWKQALSIWEEERLRAWICSS